MSHSLDKLVDINCSNNHYIYMSYLELISLGDNSKCPFYRTDI